MEPHKRWTIASSSCKFSRKRWLDGEQELITVIQEETKRVEETEDAGYTTWITNVVNTTSTAKKAKDQQSQET